MMSAANFFRFVLFFGQSYHRPIYPKKYVPTLRSALSAIYFNLAWGEEYTYNFCDVLIKNEKINALGTAARINKIKRVLRNRKENVNECEQVCMKYI